MSATPERQRIQIRRVWSLLVATTLPVAAGTASSGLVGIAEQIAACTAKECISADIPWTAAALLLSGLVLTFCSVWCLYDLGRDFISSSARITKEEEGSRKIMIMSYSPIKEFSQLNKVREFGRKLSAEDFVDPKQSENPPSQIPWQQNVRALWRVREHIQHVIVIIPDSTSPSKETGEQKKCSFANDNMQFRYFKEFLYDTFNKIDIKLEVHAAENEEGKVLAPVSHEDYQGLQQHLRAAIEMAKRRFGAGAPDICIDITAGKKPFSVAAAVVTLNRRLIFSYVDQDGNVTFYDAELDFMRAPTV